MARSVSSPKTLFLIVMSHSVSRIRILGSRMERTSSSVSSSERPTLTTTSSQIGRIERTLASTGKSSLIALRTMVKPEILTTGDPICGIEVENLHRTLGAGQMRPVHCGPMHIALYTHSRLPVHGYGGTQRVVVWLARGLLELGHRVTLL